VRVKLPALKGGLAGSSPVKNPFTKQASKHTGLEGQALVIPRGDLLCWKIVDLLNPKNQITNIKQFPMTEIQKSKQCLGLEGLVTCREPLGRTIEYWNL